MKPSRCTMRMPAILLLVLSSLSTVSSLQQPFQPAETAKPLLRRQDGGCLTNFYSCSNQGAAFNGICCQTGQICALDASNNPACCPANAVCTGTAPSTFQTPSPGSGPASFVPNAYFSFPYAQTSFANAGQCSSAVSQCSQNYNACTSRLEGLNGGGGVTVVVGATTTVAAGGVGVTMATASATSICSSLSSVACLGLQSAMCSNSGVTSGGFYFGTGTGNAAPRVTGMGMGRGLVGVGVVGVGLGVMAGL